MARPYTELGEIIQAVYKEGFFPRGSNLFLYKHNNKAFLIKIFRWIGEGARLARRPWQVSPPELGGLKYGDIMVSDVFPCVWGTIA